MKSVNPDSSTWIVADGDEALPESEQTQFEIGTPTDEEYAHLQNIAAAGQTGTFTLVALHLGLRAAKNFSDPKGNPVVFRRDENRAVLVGGKRPWLNVLGFIPAGQRDKLAAAFFKAGKLEGAAEKNS